MTGAAALTASLTAALRDHYIEPGASLPGGVFAAEVGINDVNRAQSELVAFARAVGVIPQK